MYNTESAIIDAQQWLGALNWDDIPGADEQLAVICEALQEYSKVKALPKQNTQIDLHCRPGDIVYVIWNRKVIQCRVYGISIDYKYSWYTFLYNGELLLSKKLYYLDDFGKTVFLDETEAYQALEEIKREQTKA